MEFRAPEVSPAGIYKMAFSSYSTYSCTFPIIPATIEPMAIMYYYKSDAYIETAAQDLIVIMFHTYVLPSIRRLSTRIYSWETLSIDLFNRPANINLTLYEYKEDREFHCAHTASVYIVVGLLIGLLMMGIRNPGWVTAGQEFWVSHGGLEA